MEAESKETVDGSPVNNGEAVARYEHLRRLAVAGPGQPAGLTLPCGMKALVEAVQPGGIGPASASPAARTGAAAAGQGLTGEPLAGLAAVLAGIVLERDESLNHRRRSQR